MEFDVELENAISELARARASRPLKELVPGDWTSVHVILGPDTGASIQEQLGQPVEITGDGTYGGDYIQDGDLLVFKRDGEIVRR
ncbi:hypothetical protein [Actinokineospora fastidiosa]|uniref:hypothetical protein n=1 Tax=Actinokineospora fastidiosa TaxID=1816 RepID=UPI001670E786|nr:hypothetical protein [Actinokineospora fastidiosa]